MSVRWCRVCKCVGGFGEGGRLFVVGRPLEVVVPVGARFLSPGGVQKRRDGVELSGD
jgi:hypothetical protein